MNKGGDLKSICNSYYEQQSTIQKLFDYSYVSLVYCFGHTSSLAKHIMLPITSWLLGGGTLYEITGHYSGNINK